MSEAQHTIRLANWNDHRDKQALRQIRYEVFVQEQQVPEDLEWTGDDGDCVHAIAMDAQQTPVGTGRLDLDGHIGRMAVKSSQRGRGVGRDLLRFLMDQADKLGYKEIQLNAQTHALAFYQREGFEAYGPEFQDAGIAHRAMIKPLG